MAPWRIKAAEFLSKFFILLETFMLKPLTKLKAPSLESLSSHMLIGIVTFVDIFFAKSIADCADFPEEPSILIGFPMMIPLMLFSSIILLISSPPRGPCSVDIMMFFLFTKIR